MVVFLLVNWAHVSRSVGDSMSSFELRLDGPAVNGLRPTAKEVTVVRVDGNHETEATIDTW